MACLSMVAVSLKSARGQGAEPPGFKSGEVRVRLLAPLTTKLNRKGDMVPAKVIHPPSLKDGVLEGDIREVHGGGSKRISIDFEFHTLHLAGSKIPVSATLTAVANSKSQSGLDENGSSIETEKGSLTRGGRKDKAARIAAGSTVVRLSTKAPHLALATGSELVLQVESNL